jgi:hypothetical protein
VPANLTPAGPLNHWSDGEIFRAMIGRMDDEELAAVYEYLTHLPGSQ